MSGIPYSQKSGLKNHTNERIFQVMTRYEQVMTPSVYSLNLELNVHPDDLSVI